MSEDRAEMEREQTRHELECSAAKMVPSEIGQWLARRSDWLRLIQRWPHLDQPEWQIQHFYRLVCSEWDWHVHVRSKPAVFRAHAYLQLLQALQINVSGLLLVQRPMAEFILHEVAAGRTKLLDVMGLECIPRKDPWVTLSDWLRIVKHHIPQFSVNHRYLYRRLFALPTQWYLAPEFEGAVLDWIVEPFKVTGVVRPSHTTVRRYVWGIRPLAFREPIRTELLAVARRQSVSPRHGRRQEAMQIVRDLIVKSGPYFCDGDLIEITRKVLKLRGCEFHRRTVARYLQVVREQLRIEREAQRMSSASPEQPASAFGENRDART